MVIARVVGSVVSTQKNGKLEGAKLLLAQPLDLDGKAAMMALNRGLAGLDAAIVGVVDAVDIPAEPARR